jgi:hypothetical protein
MTCCDIKLGDWGTTLTFNVLYCNNTAVDISFSTSKHVIFKKPSGNKVVKDATFVTNGTDGKLQYVVESGVFDEIGVWKVQASVYAPNGGWKSDVQSFKVEDNL